MSVEADVEAARNAVDALEQGCTLGARHLRETVDPPRLRVDVARVRGHLTLLCGAPSAVAHGPASSAGPWNDAVEDAPPAVPTRRR